MESIYFRYATEADLPGLTILRAGSNRYTHSFQALMYYIRNLRNKYDAVIEEVNGGAPYFAVFFGRKSSRYMLYHQLGRINWFYEIPAPFSFLDSAQYTLRLSCHSCYWHYRKP